MLPPGDPSSSYLQVPLYWKGKKISITKFRSMKGFAFREARKKMIGVDFCCLFCLFNTEKKRPVLSTPTKMMSQGYLSPRKKATEHLTLLERSLLMISSGWISAGSTPSFHPCGNVFSFHPHLSTPQKANTGAPSAPNPHRKDLRDR